MSDDGEVGYNIMIITHLIAGYQTFNEYTSNMEVLCLRGQEWTERSYFHD